MQTKKIEIKRLQPNKGQIEGLPTSSAKTSLCACRASDNETGAISRPFHCLFRPRGRGCVLDPFGGSGSTLIACEQQGRHCRMMEFDPVYCDDIIHRWETFTGQKAKRIER